MNQLCVALRVFVAHDTLFSAHSSLLKIDTLHFYAQLLVRGSAKSWESRSIPWDAVSFVQWKCSKVLHQQGMWVPQDIQPYPSAPRGSCRLSDIPNLCFLYDAWKTGESWSTDCDEGHVASKRDTAINSQKKFINDEEPWKHDIMLENRELLFGNSCLPKPWPTTILCQVIRVTSMFIQHPWRSGIACIVSTSQCLRSCGMISPTHQIVQKFTEFHWSNFLVMSPSCYCSVLSGRGQHEGKHVHHLNVKSLYSTHLEPLGPHTRGVCFEMFRPLPYRYRNGQWWISSEAIRSSQLASWDIFPAATSTVWMWCIRWMDEGTPNHYRSSSSGTRRIPTFSTIGLLFPLTPLRQEVDANHPQPP